MAEALSQLKTNTRETSVVEGRPCHAKNALTEHWSAGITVRQQQYNWYKEEDTEYRMYSLKKEIGYPIPPKDSSSANLTSTRE